MNSKYSNLHFNMRCRYNFKGGSRHKDWCMARVLSFLTRYFSNYYTLLRSDLAARAVLLDPRLAVQNTNRIQFSEIFWINIFPTFKISTRKIFYNVRCLKSNNYWISLERKMFSAMKGPPSGLRERPFFLSWKREIEIFYAWLRELRYLCEREIRFVRERETWLYSYNL